MIYTRDNAAGSSVFDVPRAQALDGVFSVDTDAAVVVAVSHPVRVDATGRVATIKLQFQRIKRLGDAPPYVFLCDPLDDEPVAQLERAEAIS